MANPSLLNDIGAIADGLSKIQILLCHQYGNAFRFELADRLGQFRQDHRRQSFRRLVKDDQLGIAH